MDSDQISGVIEFLSEEKLQDIQESADARGRLGAGGTLQDLTGFNPSTVLHHLQQQRFIEKMENIKEVQLKEKREERRHTLWAIMAAVLILMAMWRASSG